MEEVGVSKNTIAQWLQIVNLQLHELRGKRKTSKAAMSPEERMELRTQIQMLSELKRDTLAKLTAENQIVRQSQHYINNRVHIALRINRRFGFHIARKGFGDRIAGFAAGEFADKYNEPSGEAGTDIEPPDHYTLEIAVNSLRRYLNGKYIIKEPKEPRKKHKLHAQSGNRLMTETEKLILSIAIISGRVIRKYNRGETPHPNRMEVWSRSLEFASMLEQTGLLPMGIERNINIGGLTFPCRIFKLPYWGECALLVSEPIPCDGDEEMELPVCVRTAIYGVGKKEAARTILDCNHYISDQPPTH